MPLLFFKQKTAYEMRISDWSSDVCSSDLAYHGLPKDDARHSARFADQVRHGDPEYDSEHAYFELLQELGKEVDLRVVVDVISGASAGGINGIILGRALAHDLRIDHFRDLWLRASEDRKSTRLNSSH